MFLVAIFAISCKNNPAKKFLDSGQEKMKASTDSLQRVKNYKAALKDFDRAIELDPDYIDAYEQRAGVRISLDDYNGSLQDCKKILELDPSIKDVYSFVARIKLNHNDPRGSINAINKFINADTDNPLGYCQRASAESSIKDYNAALKDYNQAIAHSPSNSGSLKTYYNARGLTKYNLNDKNGACDDFHKSLQLGNADAQSSIDFFCK